jgi:hypothetical protein
VDGCVTLDGDALLFGAELVYQTLKLEVLPVAFLGWLSPPPPPPPKKKKNFGAYLVSTWLSPPLPVGVPPPVGRFLP